MAKLTDSARILFGVVAVTAAACGQYVPKLPKDEQAASWLDRVPQKIWNRSGKSVPHAPRGAEIEKRCQVGIYQPQTAEEKSVVKAGWFLTGKGLEHNGITVIGAESSNDGMCRPAQYQEFVFVVGQFAGTLSPVLMDSREDGALSNVSVPGDGRIVAEFLRYADKDGRCCPSRLSEAEYEIQQRDGKSVVVVKNVKTRKAE